MQDLLPTLGQGAFSAPAPLGVNLSISNPGANIDVMSPSVEVSLGNGRVYQEFTKDLVLGDRQKRNC